MRLRRLSSTLAAGLALAVATIPAAADAAPAGSGLTPDQVAQLPIDQQNTILNPLRTAADSLGAEGQGGHAGVFTGIAFDTVQGTVDLYLTDPSQEKDFIAAAAQAAPFDTTLVRTHAARYPQTALHAARDRLIAQTNSPDFTITSVSVPPDGSHLDVGIWTVSSGQAPPSIPAAISYMQPLAGVPLTAEAFPPSNSMSRRADYPPYYSGGYIMTSAATACTTGLTVHNSSRTYLMTAAHCVHAGDYVYNGNSDLEGKVIRHSTLWDAALIDAHSAQFEFDGGSNAYNPIPVRGKAYSWWGDSVCHDGFVIGVACALVVFNADTTIVHCGGPYGCILSRGVAAHRSGTAVHNGDSGGLVFCVCAGGSGPRQARGMVSSDYGGSSNVFWTEAPDILNAFGMSMN